VTSNPETEDLLSELDGNGERWGTGCSTFPLLKFFAEAIQQLGAAGMLSDPLKTRLVVKTLWSGLGLQPDAERVVQKVCKEEQVYRIDHYLGKTVQNI